MEYCSVGQFRVFEMWSNGVKSVIHVPIGAFSSAPNPDPMLPTSAASSDAGIQMNACGNSDSLLNAPRTSAPSLIDFRQSTQIVPNSVYYMATPVTSATRSSGQNPLRFIPHSNYLPQRMPQRSFLAPAIEVASVNGTRIFIKATHTPNVQMNVVRHPTGYFVPQGPQQQRPSLQPPQSQHIRPLSLQQVTPTQFALQHQPRQTVLSPRAGNTLHYQPRPLDRKNQESLKEHSFYDPRLVSHLDVERISTREAEISSLLLADTDGPALQQLQVPLQPAVAVVPPHREPVPQPDVRVGENLTDSCGSATENIEQVNADQASAAEVVTPQSATIPVNLNKADGETIRTEAVKLSNIAVSSPLLCAFLSQPIESLLQRPALNKSEEAAASIDAPVPSNSKAKRKRNSSGSSGAEESRTSSSGQEKKKKSLHDDLSQEKKRYLSNLIRAFEKGKSSSEDVLDLLDQFVENDDVNSDVNNSYDSDDSSSWTSEDSITIGKRKRKRASPSLTNVKAKIRSTAAKKPSKYKLRSDKSQKNNEFPFVSPFSSSPASGSQTPSSYTSSSKSGSAFLVSRDAVKLKSDVSNFENAGRVFRECRVNLERIIVKDVSAVNLKICGQLLCCDVGQKASNKNNQTRGLPAVCADGRSNGVV